MVDHRAGLEKAQYEPETFCWTGKWRSVPIVTMESRHNDIGASLKWASTAEIEAVWVYNNLSIKGYFEYQKKEGRKQGRRKKGKKEASELEKKRRREKKKLIYRSYLIE